MKNHRRAYLSLSALLLTAMLAGCSAVGGTPDIRSEAKDAQAKTCGDFMDLEYQKQEELAGHLAAAEQREVTPRVKGTYRDAVYDKCFDSIADEPIGHVDGWRLPVPGRLDFPDYSEMTDEQLREAFPSYSQWVAMGVKPNSLDSDTHGAGDVDVNVFRTEELKESYSSDRTPEEFCLYGPGLRTFHENPDLVSDAALHAAQSGEEMSGAVPLDSNSYTGIWSFRSQSSLDSYLDQRQKVSDGDYQCDPETAFRSVPVDVSGVGVPDAVGMLHSWADGDPDAWTRHTTLGLEVEVGDGQLLVIEMPVSATVSDIDAIDEDTLIYTEKQAAMARWLYRSLGGEEDLPNPGDTMLTSEL